MEKLLHKKIVKIEMDGDQSIVFTTDSGEEIGFNAYGDCCSSTWIAHVTGIKNLLGSTVNKVSERSFTEEDQKIAEDEYKKDSEYDPEDLQLYGYLLSTEKGTCDIDFRNESNGYYGGSLDYTTFSKKDSFKEITEDF